MQKVALRHAQMFLFAGSRMKKKKNNNNNNSNIFSSYTHGCFIAHVKLVKKQGCIYLSKVIIFILQRYRLKAYTV